MATQAMAPQLVNKTAQWAVEVDGLFCISSGAVFLFGSEAVSRFMGVQSPGVIAALGLGVLLYGIALVYDAVKDKVNSRVLQILIGLDVVWIVASVVLLAAAPDALNTEGRWTVLILGDVVAAFAIWKYVGLRRLNRA